MKFLAGCVEGKCMAKTINKTKFIVKNNLKYIK